MVVCGILSQEIQTDKLNHMHNHKIFSTPGKFKLKKTLMILFEMIIFYIAYLELVDMYQQQI